MKITKDNTCMVVYSNADGDVITHQGGNIIHKDLREAMNALIPHLAVLTEQREAYNSTLSEVRAKDDLPVKLSVQGVSISGDSINNGIQITGCRMLLTGKVLNLNSPTAMPERTSALLTQKNILTLSSSPARSLGKLRLTCTSLALLRMKSA